MIAVFLAQGFEEIEALAVVDVLRRAELPVKTVGVGGKEITGAHGICVKADMEEKEVSTDELEAVVLPGGMPGTLNLEKSPIVRTCIRYCCENDLYICAICAAPSILGHMGLAAGREVTCFPGFENELTGAVETDLSVVTDGKMITGKGPGVAVDFALEIVARLCGQVESSKIRMRCNANKGYSFAENRASAKI